jgi:hypothetical protein
VADQGGPLVGFSLLVSSWFGWILKWFCDLKNVYILEELAQSWRESKC